MEMCSQILSQKKRVTQRELFYKLLCDSPEYFTSQLQVNRTIQGHFSATSSIFNRLIKFSTCDIQFSLIDRGHHFTVS